MFFVFRFFWLSSQVYHLCLRILLMQFKNWLLLVSLSSSLLMRFYFLYESLKLWRIFLIMWSFGNWQLSGDIYEYAVVLSVKTEDQDAFERDFFQLKPYYVDARCLRVLCYHHYLISLSFDAMLLLKCVLLFLYQELSSALSARESNSWSEPTATACSEQNCWIPHGTGITFVCNFGESLHQACSGARAILHGRCL